MPQISKRVVLHFPGFEPLDAEAHRRRYARSAEQSAQVWNYRITTGPLCGDPAAPAFFVEATGTDWHTQSRIHIFDHNDLVTALRSKPTLVRLIGGYKSAAKVAWYGGLTGYFRHAWRFGLFFLFPFIFVALGLAALLFLAEMPILLGFPLWNLMWTLPCALMIFFKLFLPASERLHALHQFADWELAVSVACLDDAATNRRLEQCMTAARVALAEPADEYVISSHSMGSSFAAHVIGALMEQDPGIFSDRRVVFASLGGAVLQCSLLKPATVLRRRVGVLASCPNLFWLDVQCLTDAVHFFRAQVVRLAGFPEFPQASLLFIRFKNMLTAEHYRRIKRDFLRMHRQYVLGPDRRAAFDFTLMTAGPLPAQDFAGFTPEKLAPLGPDGAIRPDC